MDGPARNPQAPASLRAIQAEQQAQDQPNYRIRSRPPPPQQQAGAGGRGLPPGQPRPYYPAHLDMQQNRPQHAPYSPHMQQSIPPHYQRPPYAQAPPPQQHQHPQQQPRFPAPHHPHLHPHGPMPSHFQPQHPRLHHPQQPPQRPPADGPQAGAGDRPPRPGPPQLHHPPQHGGPVSGSPQRREPIRSRQEDGDGEQLSDTFLHHAVTASLIDYLDKGVTIVLSDGKILMGTFRSYDQYSNLMLEGTFERKIVGNKYADFEDGSRVVVVRGDSIILMGEIDEKAEIPKHLVKVKQEEILKLLKEEEAAKLERAKEQQQLIDDDSIYGR